MGKLTTTDPKGDRADWHQEGTRTTPGSTDWQPLQGRVNLFVTGVFTGSAQLEVSFDGGASAVPVTLDDGTVRTFNKPERIVIDEPERGILYRLVVTAISAGTLNWRFSR